MLINSIDKKTLDAVSARFGKQFIKEPLFMYFCSDINKRSQFIEDYMKYYIPRLLILVLSHIICHYSFYKSCFHKRLAVSNCETF